MIEMGQDQRCHTSKIKPVIVSFEKTGNTAHKITLLLTYNYTALGATCQTILAERVKVQRFPFSRIFAGALSDVRTLLAVPVGTTRK